jgi:hypothetical protein
MGNYNPILMQIAIQTKKSMPSSEFTKPETFAKFQDDRRRHFFTQDTLTPWSQCSEYCDDSSDKLLFTTPQSDDVQGIITEKQIFHLASQDRWHRSPQHLSGHGTHEF